MRRIGLGVAFTLSLILAALAAQAQQTGKKLPRIGYLSAHFPSPRDEAFRRGLREFGYLEGQTVTIDYRFAERRYKRLSGFAAELVRLNVAKPPRPSASRSRSQCCCGRIR